MLRVLCGFICLVSISSAAFCLNIEPTLPDAAQEQRARQLFYQVRCLSCPSEAISDSPSMMARSMRAAIRNRITEGKSDAAIREELLMHYGDAILMTPPLSSRTWLLWFGPLLALGAAGWVARMYFTASNTTVNIGKK